MSPTARVTLPFLGAPGARSTGAPEAPDLAEALAHTPPMFGGFPDLVTRIGRTVLRHLAVVPADWPRERLIELAIRQATTNRLETCLCLDPADAVFVSRAGVAREAAFVPTGLPVLDQLVIAGPLPETAELAARREALRAYARRWKGEGHVVGDGLEDGPRRPRPTSHGWPARRSTACPAACGAARTAASRGASGCATRSCASGGCTAPARPKATSAPRSSTSPAAATTTTAAPAAAARSWSIASAHPAAPAPEPTAPMAPQGISAPPAPRSMADAPLPAYESHSSISVYRACPLRYGFRYVERRPGEVSPGQFAFGNAVHKAFEAFGLARIRARAEGTPGPGPQELQAALDAKLATSGLGPDEIEEARRRAVPVLAVAWTPTFRDRRPRSTVASHGDRAWSCTD